MLDTYSRTGKLAREAARAGRQFLETICPFNLETAVAVYRHGSLKGNVFEVKTRRGEEMFSKTLITRSRYSEANDVSSVAEDKDLMSRLLCLYNGLIARGVYAIGTQARLVRVPDVGYDLVFLMPKIQPVSDTFSDYHEITRNIEATKKAVVSTGVPRQTIHGDLDCTFNYGLDREGTVRLHDVHVISGNSLEFVASRLARVQKSGRIVAANA